MDDSTGLPRVLDHFRVLTVLGKGGMGVVYRAEDLLLSRSVALKVMRPEQMADPQRRARFLREARTAASFVHPNVATVYEVGEADGTIFIAMELVAGESLRAILASGPVDAPRAWRWSVGIARALARAHDAGIVHRDLKPDNVMVLPDDEVKLLDFGIAKALAEESGESAAWRETNTAEGLMLGTPQYVSPEQAQGGAIDVRSDVFSFGTMLFEMLTGVSPFQRKTVLDTLTAVVNDAPPSLRRLARGTPPELAVLVARCLEKDRAARFASGAPLLAALEAVTVGAVATEELSPSEVPSSGRAGAPLSTQLEATFVPTSMLRAPGGKVAPVARGLAVAAVAMAVVTVGAFVVRGRHRAREAPPRALVADVGCTSHAECAREHHGAWRCNSVRHECVEIASQDCTVVADEADLYREDTAWVGKLMPTTGPAAVPFLGERRAVDLARQDFADALRGNIATDGDLHARPLGVVECDEFADPLRAAHHLADDVEVPAVIGFRWTKTAMAVIPSVFLPKHVLSMVSISQSSVVTKLPQPEGEENLIWQSTFENTGPARALAALVSEVLEPRAREAGLGRGRFRVATVSDPRVARDFAQTFFQALRFNGKSAVDNGDDYREYTYGDAGVDAERVAGAIGNFAPDAILFTGGGFARFVLEPLERAWHAARRPTYLTSSGLGRDVAVFVGTDPAKRKRFLAVTNSTMTLPNAELVLRYNSTYRDDVVSRAQAPQPSYDAMYLISYAAQVAPAGPLDGRAIARGLMRLLPPGAPAQVGPQGILPAFKTLKTGGQIDLTGALGDLDFDPKTGTAPVDFEVLCIGLDDRRVALRDVGTGLIFDAKTQQFRGTFNCP